MPVENKPNPVRAYRALWSRSREWLRKRAACANNYAFRARSAATLRRRLVDGGEDFQLNGSRLGLLRRLWR
jgi:hypothetical protein